MPSSNLTVTRLVHYPHPMSPDPYVRGQALALVLALIAVSILGSAVAGLACTALVALAA